MPVDPVTGRIILNHDIPYGENANPARHLHTSPSNTSTGNVNAIATIITLILTIVGGMYVYRDYGIAFAIFGVAVPAIVCFIKRDSNFALGLIGAIIWFFMAFFMGFTPGYVLMVASLMIAFLIGD